MNEYIAERVAAADRLALRALVNLCLGERAKLLICSGDIIDGWCRDYRVGFDLVHELLRLRDAGCEVVLLLGNHDVRSRVLRPLLLPEYARILGLSGPETRVLDRLGIALHGWSFPETEARVDVASLLPEPLPGLLNIGILHTSAEGRRGHADYAPCSRRTLRHHGYDYWALGHVHAREIVSTEPWIVFPGNLQGRGPREEGPKGATLVRIRAGSITSVEHRPLDVLRFATVVANTSETEHFDDVLTVARNALRGATQNAQGRPLVARLVLDGVAGAASALAVPAWERKAALEAVIRELSAESVWIDETWIDTGVGSWLLPAA